MLVLIDRDGVLNVDRPDSVKSIEEFEWIDGAVDAVVQLTEAGCYVAIVTNQSVVGKEIISLEELDLIHNKMCQHIEREGGYIDAIFSCTDHPDRPTNRRKPACGMIEEALEEFEMRAEDTPFIGDALRDMQAAHAAGCPRYLVQTGKGAKTIEDGWDASLDPVTICTDLADAVQQILRELKS